MNKYTFIGLLCLFFAAASFGQNKMVSSPWMANPDTRTQTYEHARVPLGLNPTFEQVRDAVFQRYPELVNLGYDLEQLYFIESPGGYHFTLGQTLNGMPLFRSGIKANLGPDGTIISFMNWLNFPQAKVQGSFVYTTAEAEAWARRNLPNREHITKVWAEPGYYPMEDVLLPILRVQTGGIGAQSNWEVLLDANNLKEVLREDRANYRKPLVPPPPPANGQGFVFHPDPITTNQTFYGSSWEFLDNEDSLSPALDNARIKVTLKDITEDNGVYYLEGPYVAIEDSELPNIPPATSVSGNFFANRSQTMFEDVNTYFHTDSLQRFIQRMGFTNLANYRIFADPHGLNGTDNSHFVSPDHMAFGQGGVDDAEDADVVVHEYGHALSHAGSPFTNNGHERQGLDEGYGDYIAAMWSYGWNSYRWQDIFSWDGHNEYWDGRTAKLNDTYPPAGGSSNFYIYGELWSSALMEAHEHPNIGRWVTNKCVFESMYGNATFGTLVDAALLVLDADSTIYNEAYEPYFRDIFCQYQILTGNQCNVVISNDELTEGLGIAVYPNPAQDFVNIRIEGFDPGKSMEVIVVNLVGQTLLMQPIQSPDTRLTTSTLQPGVYLVQVRNGNGVLQTEKLIIQ